MKDEKPSINGENKRMRGLARINRTQVQRLKQLRNAEKKKRTLKE